MTRILHGLLVAIICVTCSTKSQAQLISILPNEGDPGQTLTTTITASTGYFAVMTMQSPDVYLSGPNGTTIYGSNINLLPPDSSEANVDFSIPSNAPLGWYTLYVDYFGFVWSYLSNAFRVGDYAVSGYVFNDLNLNGVKNVGEPGIANQQVLVLPDNVYVTTNAQGFYQFEGVDNASYTLKWDDDPAYMLISPDSIDVTLDNYLTNKNFGIHTPIDAFISGHVYVDYNSNGIQDGTDEDLANAHVLVMPDNLWVLTDSSGNYSYGGAFNTTYTVSLQLQSGWTVTTSPSSYVITLTADVNNVDFGVLPPPPTVALHACVYHTWAACGTSKLFNIKVKNTGTVFIDTGYVFFVYPDTTPVTNTNPTPDVIGDDTLTWYFSDLAIGQTKTFQAWLYIPGPGIVLYSEAHASGTNIGFGLTGESTGTNSDIVTCAYDPNEKEANLDTISTLDTPIDYSIRFQNTGTDSAHNIIVRDTLSNLLDWTTFSFMSSTHPVNVQINQTNGAVAFIFDNIFLPDSNVNEPASHGQIDYRIYSLPTTPVGSIVHNTASIYFDANAPIVTNDAEVIYCNQDTVTDLQDICEGDSIQIGSTWYLQSGTYTFHSSSPAVCDISNIVTLNVIPSADINVLSLGFNLSAAAGASTYQWYDCDLNQPIAGATAQMYSATSAGSYAVIVTNTLGCSAMSECVTIVSTDDLVVMPITMTPNPTVNMVNITHGLINNGTISVQDLSGKTLISQTMSTTTATAVDLSGVASGTYFVQLLTNNKTFDTLKLIVIK